MASQRFGRFVDSTRQHPSWLAEHAPRPRSAEWSIDEIDPLTTALLLSSAFRIPGHCGEKGRMPFTGGFDKILDRAYSGAITDEARERYTWGRAPGLQRYLLEQAYAQHPDYVVLDTVKAIADITRTPAITDAKLHHYTELHLGDEQRDYNALSTPLRSLSLLAIAGLRD